MMLQKTQNQTPATLLAASNKHSDLKLDAHNITIQQQQL